jgi:hypothetical protein
MILLYSILFLILVCLVMICSTLIENDKEKKRIDSEHPIQAFLVFSIISGILVVIIYYIFFYLSKFF